MSCEECKSQIFELIEREAVDPDGVRAALARRHSPGLLADVDAADGNGSIVT